jgi:hypothetical protein
MVSEAAWTSHFLKRVACTAASIVGQVRRLTFGQLDSSISTGSGDIAKNKVAWTPPSASRAAPLQVSDGAAPA